MECYTMHNNILTQLISEAKMKKKFRNKQGKGNLSLSMVMNANCEVVMYKRLYEEQSVNAQIYKRRITTVQRNFPIRLADHHRSHSEDVWV